MRKARITLGHTDVSIRPIGMGCMGMSQFYGDADEEESVATIDAGIEFFDTRLVLAVGDVAASGPTITR